VPADPDEPTRRLPPTEPRRAVRDREVVVGGEHEAAWAVAILERLRSLRTAVALVGVLAVAALAVGLWVLLSEDADDDGQRGASPARVAELEDRVDALESDVRDAASGDAVAAVRDQQRELEERLTTLEEQAGDNDALTDLQEDVAQLSDSLEELSQAIEQLEQRFDELEQQPSAGAGP
jgi:uncharacterized coiled-coil protein SlyX